MAPSSRRPWPLFWRSRSPWQRLALAAAMVVMMSMCLRRQDTSFGLPSRLDKTGAKLMAERGHRLRGFAGAQRADGLVGTDTELTEMDMLVDEINSIASTTKHHHSATAAAAASSRPPRTANGPTAKRKLEPVLTLPGDTLEQKPSMVFLVLAATVLTAGVVGSSFCSSPFPVILGVFGGILAAELFSGVFHWATDNFGSLQTPIVGSACAAFQGHHLAPWTISFRPFCNNVYKIARAALPLVLVSYLALPPAGAAFAATMFYCQILAQEFHKWSHVPARHLAPWQRWLQQRGLAVSTAEHCRHHKPPFDAHYCILTGGLNPLLDSEPVVFWRRLEALTFRLTGVEPNCWKGEKGAQVRDRALSLQWLRARNA